MSFLPAELGAGDDDDFCYEDGFLDLPADSDSIASESNYHGTSRIQQTRLVDQRQTFHNATQNVPLPDGQRTHGFNQNEQSFHQKTNPFKSNGERTYQNKSQSFKAWKGQHSSIQSTSLFSPTSSFVVSSPATFLTEEDLKVSVIKGNVNMVKQCLQQGLPVNEVLPNGWTPLMYACNHSKSQVVQLLLQEGADPSCHVDLYTPLMCACSTSSMGPNRLECVQILVEAGADVNAKDRHHSTGLMVASRLGYLDLVEYLTQKGAKVNEQDSRGWTALTWSVQRGHKDVALTLLEAGGDCNIKHADRLTVKDMAAHMPSDEMLALLERRPVISSSDGGDMAGIGIDAGVVFQRDSSLSSPHSILGSGDSGARSTDLRYGEMEIFLLGLDLPHLMPLFQKHLIDLYLLLDMTEQDLSNVGVEQVGARKKILDASQAVHKKNWEGSSLVSVHFNKQIRCSDALAMVANVSKHIRYINSTVAYIRQHLKHHPQSIIHATDRASPTQLVRHVADTNKHVLTLLAELSGLQDGLLQEMKNMNVDPPDLISNQQSVVSSRWTGRRYVGIGFVIIMTAGLGYLWKTDRITEYLNIVQAVVGDTWQKML